MMMPGISSKWTLWLLRLLLGGAIFLSTACATSGIPTPNSKAECPECPEAACPEPISYDDLWRASAHADEEAEAFTHWDEEDPQEVPIECAKCHSRPGHLDFLGVDGTEAGVVDNAAKIDTTVTCFVCHNEATPNMDRVSFPSGEQVSNLGPEASCIQCHQGRASTATVDHAISEAGLTDDDESSADLEFVNSHYSSGATSFGSVVHGAYEYDGKTYRGRFIRGEDEFSCIRCHDNHNLELKIETCSECHTFAQEEARDIRVDTTDYDGDGDLEEGIAGEIETIHEALYLAIQAYTRDVVGSPIVHDPHSYPFFFVDTDFDGVADPDEAIYANAYHSWTPRLLRAAYNYQFVLNDPGAYAHNADYVIQALHDSLVDVGGNIAGMTRP
jgi:hypothetical protein